MPYNISDFYSNGYRPPSVIAYSSDAFVLINGVDTKIINPVSNLGEKRVSFQQDVTTISVEHGIENAGQNTASVSIMVPRHSERQYFKYGRPIIKPMQEIEIFFKGRYLDDTGAPQYYQSFWGVITEVGVDYSGGQHTIDISCKDILHLWDITRINTRPSLFGAAWDKTAQATEYTTIFNHLTPHEMILAIAWITTGSLIPPGTGMFPDSTEGLTRAVFGRENQDAMQYWEKRGRALAKRLRLFGFSGASEGFKQFKDGVAGTVTEFSQDRMDQVIAALQDVFPKNGIRRFNSTEEALSRSMWGKSINRATKLDGSLFDRFQPFNASGNQSDMDGGEDLSRLELANRVKETVDFEFYMDTTGDIIFKPPFYNMDVRSNDPVSIIRDSEILSFSANDNSEAIATRLEVHGQHTTYHEGGDDSSKPYGAYVDYNLARQFGVKSHTITRSFLQTYDQCVAYAISELSTHNAKRYTSNMTIVGRPELRLGFPVYIESMDTFYYVVGINHTYSASGRLETALQLEAARRKHIVYNQETGEPIRGHQLDNSDTLRPVLKGAPNMVLVADPYDSIEALGPIIEKGNLAEATFAAKYPEDNEKRIGLNKETPASTQNTAGQAAKKDNEEKKHSDNQSPAAKTPDPKTSKATASDNKPESPSQRTQAELKTAPPPLTEEQQKLKELAEADLRRKREAEDREKQQLLSQIADRDRALRIKEQAESRKASKTLNTNLGATADDATAQAVAFVASQLTGPELQSYGKLTEKYMPGVLHADTFIGIPVSDESGYEVIGGFGYGRGTKLTRDGEIVPFLTYTTSRLEILDEDQGNTGLSSSQFSPEEFTSDSPLLVGKQRIEGIAPTGSAIFSDPGNLTVRGSLESLSLDTSGISDLPQALDPDRQPATIAKGTLGGRNVTLQAQNHESLKSTELRTNVVKVVDVKNWVNSDGVVPRTASQYNAQAMDHTARFLGKTPNDPSGFVYRGVGKYLSDFTSVPAMTVSVDEERFLQETFGVVKDSEVRNKDKTTAQVAKEANVLPEKENKELQANLRTTPGSLVQSGYPEYYNLVLRRGNSPVYRNATDLRTGGRLETRQKALTQPLLGDFFKGEAEA